MHITQFTDYALRALIYLGTNDDRRVTIQEIAERFGVSRNHLMKVVNELIRNGYADGVRELVECFASGCKCILDPDCQLKSALSRALDAFLTVLDGLTLADLLGSPEHSILRLSPVEVPRKLKRCKSIASLIANP